MAELLAAGVAPERLGAVADRAMERLVGAVDGRGGMIRMAEAPREPCSRIGMRRSGACMSDLGSGTGRAEDFGCVGPGRRSEGAVPGRVGGRETGR